MCVLKHNHALEKMDHQNLHESFFGTSSVELDVAVNNSPGQLAEL